ncbi:hypothetical protein AQUCO_00400534v1 [Aquilegia coerulea]|uniref:Late embryogenesis abundant protein LEA-2 subgroup domain-containing protein n=1 Tax=Aquilegia coerulea TaxID=218851 RepID=A0A2G5EVD9_AQUCA|nr:hypothetical protein AQUCO_00400534v1 [Aquilegia coerulea]
MEVISSKFNKSNTTTSTYDHHKRNTRRRNIFLAITLILLGVIILLIILYFTVFKPKHPVTTINSIDLEDLQVSFDLPRLRLNLNLTLIVNLSIKNPNKASFIYGNDSTSLLYYRNDVVGQGILPGGKISSGETKVLDTKLVVLADRLIANSNVYTDVVSGMLPLTTYTKISGKVSILNSFKHHLVSYSWCDIVIDVMNQRVSNSGCRYKTKF